MIDKNEYSLDNESKNSLGKYRKDKLISIDDIDFFTKKVKITSPRSIKAMRNLGITNENLEYLTKQEYLNKHPELIGEDENMKKVIYEHKEVKRKELIEKVREARRAIIEEGDIKGKRCASSKYRKNLGLESIPNNSIKFTEKDLKAFKRMRNINKTNLFNRLEIELRKEIKNLSNRAQARRDKENHMKLLKQLEQKLKYENKKRISDEEEKEQLAKEIDKRKRKEEEQRIEDLIELERKEKILEKMKQQDELKRLRESKEKQQAYNDNLKQLRELEQKTKEEKSQKKKLQIKKNRSLLMKAKEEKRVNSEANFRKKREINEANKKRIEEENYFNNQKLLFKHQSQQLKRERDEARKNREMKKRQKKVIAYLSKVSGDDLETKIKQKNLNENQIWELFNKTEFLTEKEKKLKEAIIKNEIIMNKRKENIMNQIHDKEKNIDRAQTEKDLENLIEKEKRVIKKMDQDTRVKLITQYLINKREDLRNELLERDKKVDQFMRNKTGLIHKKRNIFDEIMKENDLDNEKYEKIMNKKSFDKNAFKSFKDIFPDNEKMDDLINAINIHLNKNKNYRYSINYP